MRSSAIYVIGISCWIVFTAFCTQANMFHAYALSWSLVQIIHLSTYSLAFLVVSIRAATGRPLMKYGLCVSAVVFLGLYVLVGVIGLLGNVPLWLQCVSVMFLAISSACGYCQWVRLLAVFDGAKPKVLLALGSIVPICAMFFDAANSLESLFSFSIYGLACPIGYGLLVVNTLHIEKKRPENVRNDQGERILSGGAARSLATSVACAMALAMISPFGRAVYAIWLGAAPAEEFIAPAAHLTALLIIAFIWFVLGRQVTLLQIYGMTLPVVVSLLLVCAFANPRFLWLVLFIGDGCFFFVSLLMVVASLDAAHRYSYYIVAVYGLFAGSVYLSNVIQQLLNYAVHSGVLDGKYYLLILLLLYLLIVPAFFLVSSAVMRKEQRKKEPGRIELVVEGENMSIEDACRLIAEERRLTPRQAELLVYFARGRDVAYIAEALVLSPNTIRSYRKALYAALNAHSRQELIDIVEARLREARLNT